MRAVPLIAHIADTHLGYAQLSLEEREEDVYSLFEEAVRRAVLEERADLVVLSGDVFDKPRPPNKALVRFRRALEVAEERGVKVVAVAGEHDLVKTRRDVSVLEVAPLLVEGLVVLWPPGSSGRPHKLEVRTSSSTLVLYGAPAYPRTPQRLEHYRGLFARYEREARAEEGVKVLAAHLPVEGFMSSEFEPSLPRAHLPRGFSYYALGHLHARAWARTEEGALLAYPGSIDVLNRGEIESWRREGKGFYLVDLSGDEARIERVDLDVRPQIAIEGELGEVLTSLGRELGALERRRPLVFLEVEVESGQRDRARAEIEKMLRGRVLDYRLVLREKMIELGPVSFSASKSRSEVEVVSSILGLSEELARALVELKACLASRRSADECRVEVERYLELIESGGKRGA
ncbi:MAG: exonuclease SbcCD subunit D [Fervidicoccaceae archaeon]